MPKNVKKLLISPHFLLLKEGLWYNTAYFIENPSTLGHQQQLVKVFFSDHNVLLACTLFNHNQPLKGIEVRGDKQRFTIFSVFLPGIF